MTRIQRDLFLSAYFKIHVVLDLKQYPSKLALGVAMFAKGVYNI